MEILKQKVIPAKKVRQFYKRFANGEQNIELYPVFGIIEQDRRYYWQSIRVFNLIPTFIHLYGKDLTEEQLYGRHGLVSLLEPFQRDYNRIMNLHREHIEFATYGYMAVEDGSVDADELCEEGVMAGKIILYRQGARTPEVKKDTLNTKHYTESAEFIRSQMEEIALAFEKANKGVKKQ